MFRVSLILIKQCHLNSFFPLIAELYYIYYLIGFAMNNYLGHFQASHLLLQDFLCLIYSSYLECLKSECQLAGFFFLIIFQTLNYSWISFSSYSLHWKSHQKVRFYDFFVSFFNCVFSLSLIFLVIFWILYWGCFLSVNKALFYYYASYSIKISITMSRKPILFLTNKIMWKKDDKNGRSIYITWKFFLCSQQCIIRTGLLMQFSWS